MSKFVPLGQYKAPKFFPVKVTAILSDGSFEDCTMMHSGDDLQFSGEPVAIKVEQTSIDQRVLNAFAASPEGQTLWGAQIHGVSKFAKWAAEQGYLSDEKDVEGEDTYLDKEIAYITQKYSNLPYSAAKDIRNWFENPDKYPEVQFDIRNELLTVKYVACGRVIVLPTGHTLAYSYARGLYGILCGQQPYDHHIHARSIKAREYYGRNSWDSPRRHTWSMRQGMLLIGCQRIPARAIQQLALREGWSGKILSKYL